MSNLNLKSIELNSAISGIQQYYDAFWNLGAGRAYNQLKNDNTKCNILDDFENFTKEMTQGKFYSIWKIFEKLTVKDLFFSNRPQHCGEAREVTMPSVLFYQLNTAPWFTQKNDDGNYFVRPKDTDETCIPDSVKEWISASPENQLIWQLMHFDLADKIVFQTLLKFRNGGVENYEADLFNLLEKDYGVGVI